MSSPFVISKGIITIPNDFSLMRAKMFLRDCIQLVGETLIVLIPSSFVSSNDPIHYLSVIESLYSSISEILMINPLLDVSIYPDWACISGEGFVELKPTTDYDDSSLVDASAESNEPVEKFHKVLIAGTFDHLHCGHKLILTHAIARTQRELLVGFTDGDALLGKKRFKAVMHPISQRVHHVREFLLPLMRNEIELNCIVTQDHIGPAGSISFDALAVTSETRSGGDAVNKFRADAGLPQVKVIELPLIMQNAAKFSSTTVREFIVNKSGGFEILSHVEERWNLMSNQFSLSVEIRQKWWVIIATLYAQTWRKYHTLFHIYELLSFISPDDLLQVLTAFFHDAIYRPWRADNEDKSVDLFEQFCTDSGLKSDSVSANVIEIILATKAHVKEISKCNDVVRRFLELDLGILASESDRYETYANQIREEYEPYLPEGSFNQKRLHFLENLIPSLEQNSLFADKGLNQKALTNVSNEISRIRV